MTEYNRYVPEEQMFATDEVLEPDENHLHFMRELVAKGKFNDDIGAEVIVFQAPIPKPYEISDKPTTPQENIAQNGDY